MCQNTECLLEICSLEYEVGLFSMVVMIFSKTNHSSYTNHLSPKSETAVISYLNVIFILLVQRVQYEAGNSKPSH